MESVSNSDNSSESINAEKGVESCQVGEAACEIPLELFDLPDLKTILSLDVWKTSLTEEDRQSLTAFLPPLNEETVAKTIEELLAGTNFHFGNPLSDFFEQLKSGFCRTRVARYRDQLKFLQRQKHYHSIKEYHNRMVNIFVEMQKLWEDYPNAEIDERVEIWKSRKSSILKPQIDQRHTDEIVEDLQIDRWITQSPRKMEIAEKTIEEVTAPSQKRLKNHLSRRVPKGLGKVKVVTDQVMQDVKRISRSGPKGVLKVTDSALHVSAGHSAKKISFRPEPGVTSLEQAVNLVVGKDLVESDKWSSSKNKEKTMGRKFAESTKFQSFRKEDKHKKEKNNQHTAILQHHETSHHGRVTERKKRTETPEKLEAEPEETLKLSQSQKSEKSSDAKDKSKSTVAELKKSSLKQDMIALHCADSLKVEDRRSKQGDDFQDVAGKAESGTRKRRPKKEKEIVGQLKVEPQKKRPKVEKKARMMKEMKDLHADQVLEDVLGKVQLKLESFEDQKHDEQMNKFLERKKPVEQRVSGQVKQPYYRKSSKDETDGRSFKKNGKREKKQDIMNGCLERKLGLEEDVPRKPSHLFGVNCERPSKLLKNKQRQKPRIQNLDSLSLNMEISPTMRRLSEKEGSSFSVKSSRKLVPALAESLASALSFSVSYLLSAVRLALICNFVDRSFDLHQGDQTGSRMDEVKLEKPLMDVKREISALSCSPGRDLVSSLKQPKTDLSLHDRGEGVVSIARSCPLHFSEIVKRVQDNPGDSRLLDNREILQDLVRGALKVFSSRIAPAGAKAWKPLASYDKQTRSWSWIGPPPGVSLQDPWEMQILPEAWGVPQKILDKLEETFANWFKHGQETLQQILKFPLPPPPPMPIILDEKERFRELRTQKSLITIPTSSEDVRAFFQMEELVRYSLPDRAFPYTAADGRKSVVAPLRICGVKLTSKARDHFMLKPDRPPHVTILCLVRDAAARLPQSIGTRADVCALIRDSQFIIEDVSDAQVNQVVSGALDRLHYERDPCVRFDGERKLWMYLHSDRHEEDFEDDGTSSTKRWKKPKKEVTDYSAAVQTRCENGSTCVLDEDLSANGTNLELNSPDGFDIGEPSAIYSAESAELVYSKSSSLSSPRVLGNGMNRSLADGEGLPFIELPPLHCGGVEFQNGHTTAWSTIRRHGLIWQQGNQFQPNQHFFQDNPMATTAVPDAMLDSIRTE
ncbi:hypothetical protein O6H91_12G078500 [Diphasiastrum complanatum]|nr:hypothetical protein O6H91_12G078500 [Diphasiastrum complanatum]